MKEWVVYAMITFWEGILNNNVPAKGRIQDWNWNQTKRNKLEDEIKDLKEKIKQEIKQSNKRKACKKMKTKNFWGCSRMSW